MKEIEDKIKYNFRDKELLKTALTHSSYSREHGTEIAHNERLEFLGDAFLDAIISAELYRMFPGKEEGFLSRTRAALVCEKSLVLQAHRVELGDHLRLGHGEEKTGGRERDSILADALEAVIGAVFIDGGYECARDMVLDIFKDAVEDAKNGKFIVQDHKTALQELLQSRGVKIEDIRYVDVEEIGPEHAKIFTVRLLIEGTAVAEGKGKSKKQAQQNAAELALARRKDAF